MVTKKDSLNFRHNFKGVSYVFPPYKEIPFKALEALYSYAKLQQEGASNPEQIDALFKAINKLESWNESFNNFTEVAGINDIQAMIQKWSAHSGTFEELKK